MLTLDLQIVIYLVINVVFFLVLVFLYTSKQLFTCILFALIVFFTGVGKKLAV